MKSVNPFLPNVPFKFPCKHQKTKGFLVFSGGSERNIGKEMVNVPQISMNTIFNFNSVFRFTSEVYLKLCEIYIMELFAKIFNSF